MNLGGVIDENNDEENEVISDLSNLFIAENQIYKDKETLMEVMQHYGVIEKFRFLVSRSSSSCYYLKCPSENCSWLMNSSSYLYILEQTYPGSVLSLGRKECESFLYAFVVLEACIRGWEYCRPVAVVDGAALRGAYGGTMLTPRTTDPGGHILPLAYAIVDSENDASWTWFFEKFRKAYGERENMCFMSYRNESIWKRTARNFHRNTEDLKKLSFTMAKAYTIQQFEAIMKRIDQIDPRIRGYLFHIGYSKWSRTYSKCKRTWTMTSNIAESLNNVNMIARRLPVILLLEFMRITIQTWIHKHNEKAAKTRSELTKKYDLKLQKSIALSTSMRV
ncbi:hypothetical protein KY290_031261 [Solanum tuberosum]|uniref:MULE transposase domain-containing protein n=1 Tax=Solanum tuberosum TaxID=4113 RepID=A0ABQ7UAH4_SOLTU|nr:hypothetical protein KY290_031261 [Solanum tuberosum]